MIHKLSPITTPNITTPHGFFTRTGGVSTGDFSSLNCGMNKGDSLKNVAENRRRIMNHFNVELENLCLSIQVHSNKPHYIKCSRTFKEKPIPEADALITSLNHIVLGVLTADCGPILLHDPITRMCAAIHAGWRGAVSGIIENTINMMITHGSKVSDIQAAIGPCLWSENFIVQEDFIINAKKHLKHDLGLYLSTDASNHIHFDLPMLLLNKLAGCGVLNISNSPLDTYAHEDDFFSFRRKTHKNELGFGVQLSCIRLSPEAKN